MLNKKFKIKNMLPNVKNYKIIKTLYRKKNKNRIVYSHVLINKLKFMISNFKMKMFSIQIQIKYYKKKKEITYLELNLSQISIK